MSDHTNIEWCDSTFNPWIGCTKVSPACDHCYAERLDGRGIFGGAHWGAGVPRKRTSEANWRKPLAWNAQEFVECPACGWRGEWREADVRNGCCPSCNHLPERFKPARRRVFCASLADVFDNEVPVEWRRDLFQLIEATPNIDWLVLTKRIGNVSGMVPAPWVSKPFQHGPDPSNIYPAGWPANVWLGATICNQEEADRDIPKLLSVPAAVRFLSIEPMLGPIDIRSYVWPVCGWWKGPHHSYHEAKAAGAECGLRRQALVSAHARFVDWIIAGGESGPQARPSHPDWFRSLRDQCKAAGVPFLFKQWGEWKPISQMAEPEHVALYASRVKAKPHESQDNLDDICGRACTVQTAVIHIDGSTHGTTEPMAFLQGTEAMQSFKVGKKAAGRLLDGVTHNGFPEAA